MTRVEGRPRVAYSNVKQRRFLLVTTGHSRLKNGVASLAYDPVVHAEQPLSKPHRQSCFTSAWNADQVRQ